MSKLLLPFQKKKLLPFLPDDLVTENIIVRLPVKSVGRFRCVSKPWRSRLSSPEFARAHLKIHTDHEPEGSILVSFFTDFSFCTLNLGNERRMVPRSMPTPLPSSYVGTKTDELQGSCHGLVLVKGKNGLNLFNPITRETLRIPVFCSSSFDLGLGYDSVLEDYKIVCLTENRTVGIYSVKMETWSNIGDLPYDHCEAGGLFVNGCLHWPAWGEGGLVLAAFSLAKEKFNKLPPPKGFNDSIFGFTLTVLGGWLALVFKDKDSMDIWVMKEYGVQDSWTKYTLAIARKSMLTSVGFLGEDEVVFVKGGFEPLLASSWRTGVSRDLFHAGIPCIDIDGITNFRESLISPINIIDRT